MGSQSTNSKIDAKKDKEDKERGMRLTEARSLYYRSATDCAIALNQAVPTYLAHEAGRRVFKKRIGEIYAEHLGINYEWLFNGKGQRDSDAPANLHAIVVDGRNEKQSLKGLHQVSSDYDVVFDDDDNICAKISLTGSDIDTSKVYPLKKIDLNNAYIPLIVFTPENKKLKERRHIRLYRHDDREFEIRKFVPLLNDYASVFNCDYAFAINIESSDFFSEHDLIFINPEKRTPDRNSLYAYLHNDKIIIVRAHTLEADLGAESKDKEVVYTMYRAHLNSGNKPTLKLEDFEKNCLGRFIACASAPSNDVFTRSFPNPEQDSPMIVVKNEQNGT